MPDRYEPAAFEAKWRQRWKEADLFRTREEPGRPKFYGLDFFPYPSGAGLSVGHCRNYIPTDVLCRMRAMQGYNVLHPMGFDAFGLPAENEAIKRQKNPAEMIAEYTATYRRQMDLVGIGYDWSRSFASCHPGFYKWTQWIFELLHKRGLAYRALGAVNWCPKDKTALANEEVVGGLCERCGTPVEKREIPQWYFKITDYADRLIDDLDTIDWPEGIKAQQRNWIGRSEGVEFSMPVLFLKSEPGPVSSEAQSQTADTADDELRQLEQELREEGYEPSLDPRVTLKIEEISGAMDKAVAQISAGSAHLDSLVAEVDRRREDLEIIQHECRLYFQVFTTRIDTIFGMTFCVLSPEHEVVDHIAARVEPARRLAIDEYRARAASMSDADRTVADREKTGVFTGAYALNPVTKAPVPIWIADYVLATYGTGAIMAVPAGDQRDLEFAVKFDLPVVPIQRPTEEYFRQFSSQEPYDALLQRYMRNPKEFPQAFVDKEQPLINAAEYTGMAFEEATRALGEWMEKWGIGRRKVQYKLRDWLISRQRYWGCPIPIIHSADGQEQLVPEECLPVMLPDIENYEPSGDGSSPLARIDEWVNVTDLDGRLGRRETDTMGGFACSSWYFLRFCDPHNDEQAWDAERVKYWMPVDCYVGGAEHAVMHLLYARFWTKVLFDAGLVHVPEPFARLENQGQVLARTPYRRPREGETLDAGEDGILISFEEAAQMPEGEVMWRWSRMSKSKGNVVTPDEAVEAYGADALRVYELFVAPFNADVQWSSEGMMGAVRFLGRVFKLTEDLKPWYEQDWKGLIEFEELDEVSRRLRRATHQTIRKATQDIEEFAFNTYISSLMIYVNELMETPRSLSTPAANRPFALAASEALETLILLLSPAAPHTADELWESIGRQGFTYHAEWPRYDEALAAEDVATIAVQVNGKLRDTVEVPTGASNEEHEAAARASSRVAAHLEGKAIRKTIVVPGKLVNLVVS